MTAAPEWLKVDARVYYRPSIGGQQFAAVVDSAPVLVSAVQGSYVVRLREVEAPYGLVHHGDNTRTTVKAANHERLEPRGVLTAREVLREVQGEAPSFVVSDKPPSNAAPWSGEKGTALALQPHWSAGLSFGARKKSEPVGADIDSKATFDATVRAEAERFPTNPKDPPIVTLCGSTRFRKAFESATYRLTLEGWAVFSVGSYAREHGTEEARDALTDEQKHNLDSLHLRKIGMSARVHVLNPGGYIGESTGGEIAYAFARGILITFLDEDAGCRWLEEHSHQLGRAIAKHAGGAR